MDPWKSYWRFLPSGALLIDNENNYSVYIPVLTKSGFFWTLAYLMTSCRPCPLVSLFPNIFPGRKSEKKIFNKVTRALWQLIVSAFHMTHSACGGRAGDAIMLPVKCGLLIMSHVSNKPVEISTHDCISLNKTHQKLIFPLTPVWCTVKILIA
jgi:hypothetical protein